jgi:hypothetical protein
MNCRKLSKAELKQIAIDIVEGKIYTSMHYSMNQGTLRGIERVFLPLAFGAGKKFPIPLEELGLLYEQVSRATSLMSNGEPTFLSFNYLTREQTDEVMDYYNSYLELKEKFTNDG